MDGAKTGKPVNDSIIKSIAAAIDVPVQIGGGIRTLERAEELLSYGIERVILGTIAIENPSLIKKLTNKHPGKIIIGIDAKNGKVATRGWIKQSEIKAKDLAKNLSNLKLAAIITTDISTDGTLEGPNFDFLREVACNSDVPVIASGGVASISDLIALTALENHGITGVIIGRALYDQKIDLKEAIKAVSKPPIKDSTNEDNIYFV